MPNRPEVEKESKMPLIALVIACLSLFWSLFLYNASDHKSQAQRDEVRAELKRYIDDADKKLDAKLDSLSTTEHSDIDSTRRRIGDVNVHLGVLEFRFEDHLYRSHGGPPPTNPTTTTTTP